MTQAFDVLIIGSGHAGAQAAIALRQHKFTGSIGIIGEEAEYPYERPALSKEYLAGEKQFERLLLRPQDFWSERSIVTLFGLKAEAVNAEDRLVLLSSGAWVAYRHLIWATGGKPRRLKCSGHSSAGVHTVRSRADVDLLKSELPRVSRVVIIGGGYIGLETAAVLRKLGKEVVLLEALDRVLARVAGEPISQFFEEEHRAHGVDLRIGTTVECIEESSGSVSAVKLADGTSIPADVVIVGIGITPAVDPLIVAGASCSNGVDIDAFCQTSLAGVFAIGDCAAHESRFAAGARVRIESVQNANDQASAVAKTIVGTPTRYSAVPWFWSNQYDLKLQTVGLSIGHDEVDVSGDVARRSFSVVYRRNGSVVALDCVNSVKDFVQGRKLLHSQMSAD